MCVYPVILYLRLARFSCSWSLYKRLFHPGEWYMTMNLHSLLHPDAVKNLGPVWAHSCFAFEAANGELHTLFHASHAVEKQVSFYLKRLVECWKCDAFVACMVDFAAEKPLHMQGRTKLSYMNYMNCTCHRLSATLAHCTNCRVSITTRQSTGGHVQENGWTWNVYTHLIKAIVLVTCCFYMQEGPWHCWQTHSLGKPQSITSWGRKELLLLLLLSWSTPVWCCHQPRVLSLLEWNLSRRRMTIQSLYTDRAQSVCWGVLKTIFTFNSADYYCVITALSPASTTVS